MNEPFILINGAGSEPIRSFKEDQLVTLINDVVHHIKVVIFDDHHQNVISKIGHLLPKEVLILPVLSLPELAAISKKATFLIGNEGGATHYCATQCQSLKLFASKSYDHHFYAFLANRNRFIKKELENMAVWSNGAGDYAIIPKPRRRYPFRPYYIDHEQPNIAIENIVAIILEVINNRMIGET